MLDPGELFEFRNIARDRIAASDFDVVVVPLEKG
jgi:hypothetical protein